MSILLVGVHAVGRASGLDAHLDSARQGLVMNQATILAATLTNRSTSTFYLTGLRIDVGHTASASVYKEDRLMQQIRVLEPGQSWDGPMMVVTPAHRGPLLVRGSVMIQGGFLTTSTGTLASIPLQLPINDPNRNADGSFLRDVDAQCDRPMTSCCDAEEAACFQANGHCVYVADGFNEQRVCRDGAIGKSYDHISHLQVSTDNTHVVYLGSDHCSTSGIEQTCRARLVWDVFESPDYEAINGPCFSQDGRHVAYEVGAHCRLQHATQLVSQDPLLQCREKIIWIDGSKASALPAWCSIPITLRAFSRASAHAETRAD